LTGLTQKRWKKLEGRERELIESEITSLTLVGYIHLLVMIMMTWDANDNSIPVLRSISQ